MAASGTGVELDLCAFHPVSVDEVLHLSIRALCDDSREEETDT